MSTFLILKSPPKKQNRAHSYLSSLRKRRMAEFVVSFVLERLQNLASEEASLLHGVGFQVEQIRVEFKRMQCFLKDADARESESETIHNLVVEIKDITYDAEDVLETYVLRVASRTSVQSFLKRCVCIFNEGKTLHKVGLEIQSIKPRISQLTTSLQTYGIRAITEGEGSSSSAYERQQRHVLRRSYSHVVEKDFVGLEEDVEKLVGVLLSEDKDSYHQTVSICGMGGLGKTTIAQKVYNDQNVKRHFDGFAWACVSQQWQTKDILQTILTKLVPHDMDRIVLMREEALVRKLLEVQQSRKCLIVIDDIWSEAAWDCIRPAFPIGDMGSKILITTRNRELALHVDPHGFLHEPRLLNEDESWGLLQKKVFTKSDDTDNRDGKNFEELARKMVRHCGGLPLAVVVLAGILITKQTLREWEMVHRNISSCIRKGKGMGQQHGVSPVLALSYSDLPYQLKSCFLYLGNFPEDSEIEADKLYQLWTAEGLVSLDDRAEAETMMDVAECYLGELAHRYMVQVEVDEFTGRFKSCNLHDLMRDLCLLKGKEQNFLTVIDFRHGSEKFVDSSLDCKVRRLAVHLDEEDDRCVFPMCSTAQHLRSLSFFVPSRTSIPKKFHLKDFKVLRVLDLSHIQFSKKLAKAIGKLIHLRYLSLRGSWLGKLPSSIGNLGCLQTLDLRMLRASLFGQYQMSNGTIPNVLWKMKSLRHLYLHDQITPIKKLRLDGLGKLEILETFTTNLFDVKDLLMLTNLRKLKAHVKVEVEDLVAIINYLNSRANRLQHSSFYIEYNFCCEEEASLLRQLLECHRLNTLHLGGVIDKLPEHHHFSPSLTVLEFSGSELKEDPMATLEKLPNLRSLALSYNAFVGVEMVCSTLGFPQLKFLKLWELSNLEDWMVNEGAMPNLSSLEIKDCERLKMVPDGLRFISTLQELQISTESEEFKRRLRVVDGEEGADFYKIQHVPSIIFFPVLSI